MTSGPRTVSLHEAMQASQALARLEQRIQASRSRFDVVRVTLPVQLLQGVKPGPWDETGWTLFVSNGATAAKLRQWLPKLEDALVSGGFERIAIRIRIQANT